MKKMKKSIWWSFFSAILFIIFALILLLKEENMISTAILVVGFLGILWGGLHFIQYFKMDRELKPYSNDITQGIIFLVFGVIALFKNVVLADMVTYLLGAYLIYHNATRAQICFHLSDMNGIKVWKYVSILNVIGIVLGAFIVLNPFENISISIVIAYCVLISECLSIIQNIALLIGFGKKNENI